MNEKELEVRLRQYLQLMRDRSRIKAYTEEQEHWRSDCETIADELQDVLDGNFKFLERKNHN